MAVKTVLFCAFAYLVQQSIAGLCYPKPPCGCSTGGVSIKKFEEIEEISYKPVSKGYSGSSVSIAIPSSGGAFQIYSIGPIAPSGIAVSSDLALGGNLELSGVLPYLSAVAFDGEFQASGTAPVAYGCGDCVAITEQIGGAGYSGGAGYAGSYGGAYGCGCGCKY